MKIQMVSNQVVSKKNSSKNKSNQPAFSGGSVFYLKSDLGVLADEVSVTGRAIKKYKGTVKKCVKDELNIFVWKMPNNKAKVNGSNQQNKFSESKMPNVLIEYHDTKNGTRIMSPHFLNPNATEIQIEKGLENDLLRNFPEYASAKIWQNANKKTAKLLSTNLYKN